MPEVLSREGLPILTDFAGGNGTPLVVNVDTGRGYVLRDDNTIVPLGAYTYDVRDYGVSQSASAATNAAGFQAAIDAAVATRKGEILIPPGTYDFNVGLVQAPASAQTHINWRGLGGSGENGVVLRYTGSGGTALTIKNNTRYSMQNIALLDGGTGSIGLALTSLTNGSNHGSSYYNLIYIDGFTTGLAIGDSANRAASELLFGILEVKNATDGVLITGKTDEPMFSTNIRFHFLASSFCTTQLRVTGNKNDDGAGVAVFGGSTSFNTRDFDFEVPGTYYIGHQRIEGTLGQLIRSGNADPTLNSAYVTNVTIEDMKANYTATTDGKVAMFYQPGHYTIRGSTLQTGYIELGGYDGGAGPRKSTLTVEQSTIVRSGTAIRYKASSNTVWVVDHRLSGNTIAEAVNMDDDRTYLVKTDGTEHDILTGKIPWSASAGTLTLAGVYVALDTTPTVIATHRLVIANAIAVTITALDDGFDGQEVTLVFSDGNTTIQDNSSIHLAGGASFTGTTNDTLVLTNSGGVWYQTGGSIN
jgi:hypothetical protein